MIVPQHAAHSNSPDLLWNLSFPLTSKIAYVLEVFRKVRLESFIAFIQAIVTQFEILAIYLTLYSPRLYSAIAAFSTS